MGPAEFIAELRKGKPGPVYLLRGADRFLQEVCREALAGAVPAEARDWCLVKIEFEPGRLGRHLQAAEQRPMLGGRTYLVFSDPEDFKRAADQDVEALESYLARPSPFATVVFVAGEPDRRRRFTQLLEKKAEVVAMRPLDVREAAAWTRDFLHRAGVEVDPGLAEEIAAKFENTNDREPERAGVNLLRLRTELEKLLTARLGAKRLERADLEILVPFREEHQISAFLQALAKRDCGEALERLRALLASRTAETLMLWTVTDLLRQALKAQGQATAASAGRYGSWQGWSGPRGSFSNWEVAAKAARTYSTKELVRALQLARQTDLGIKSAWKDAGLLLEFLVWQIVVGRGGNAASLAREEMPSPPLEP